ncbi:MAG: DUF2339 domain-containing protein [Cytophagales bacterium]|nr:DUF2339 domain-containing protein [Bernardetiaceae bacterium]MDW8205235.1 DUF2339 domain-containing protein [Cytophagales bacterium]
MADSPEHHTPPSEDEHLPQQPSDPLSEQIDRFVAEILENREAIQQSKGDYNPLLEDDAYRLLREKGLSEATKDYDLSHYPFYVPPRKRSTNERKDQPDTTIDWKKIEQKVYLKAFLEPDEDELEEQIRAEVAKRKGLSYEKTRQMILERLSKSKDDFERFIYEDVFSKIAALIFTLGVAMLIRYGIAEGVLPEAARVAIGLLTSGILFAIAKRMENSNETFSLLFATSALFILYYTNYLAFKEYYFLSHPVAFFFMLCIVGLSLWLSLHYEQRYFAVLAIIGAYLTPFVISGERVYYEYFFGYLLLITCVTIAIAYFKQWTLLNYLSFVATVLIFIGWAWRVNLGSVAMLQIGLTFSTLFYLTYFAMHVLHSLRPLPNDQTQVPMSERDLFFFSLNVFFFIFMVYRLLSAHFLVGEYFGWWLIAISLLNGSVGWWLYNKPQSDKYIRKYLQTFALLGVSIGAILIWHTAKNLHLIWLVETVLLLLLSRYWQVALFRDVAVLTFAASLLMLLIIWFNTYTGDSAPVFLFNDAVLATAAAVIAYVVSFILVRMQANQTSERLMFLTYEAPKLQVLFLTVSVVLLYLCGNMEFTYHHFAHPSLERLVIGIYNTVFALLLWVVAMRTGNARFQNIAHYTLMTAVISYIVFAHPKVIDLRNAFLLGTAKASWFFVHYINLALDLTAIYLLLSYKYGVFRPESVATEQEPNSEQDVHFANIDYSVWLACAALVFHLTAELDHLYVLFGYNPQQSFQESLDRLLDQTQLFFYPILWLLIALGFMLLGVKWRIKDFRIIASALLGVMLLKLLAYDIWRVSRFTQILLMIIVGGLLMIVSYLNTQLRKFLVEGRLNMDEIYRKLTGKLPGASSHQQEE